MTDMTVAQIARQAVEAIDGDQLARFELVLSAYRASPRAAARAGRASHQPAAAAPVAAGDSLSALALAAGVELAQVLGEDGRVEVRRRRWFARTTVTPDTVVRPVGDTVGLRDHVRDFCLGRGAPTEWATSIADFYDATWPRAAKA